MSRETDYILSKISQPAVAQHADLKKFKKMAKYQKHSFIKETGLTEIEQMLAEASPSKRQLIIFNNFFR